jgi:hypothetical protein
VAPPAEWRPAEWPWAEWPWAALRVGTPADLAGAVTRAHLADGRVVGWVGPVPGPDASGARMALAIDAELADAEVPRALARRFGTVGFWTRWTRAECLCKLADLPMHVWWRRHGLEVPAEFGGTWRTVEANGLVVTVAVNRDVTRPWSVVCLEVP